MNRFIHRFLPLFLLVLLLCALPSCTASLMETETVTEEEPKETASGKTEEKAAEKAALADLVYTCADSSVLSTYKKKSREDFDLACSHLEQEGYTLYSFMETGENPARTYVKGSALAHVYYHPANGELNLVLSETAADTLPPAEPAGTGGNIPCTVTQLNQYPYQMNGMGYVIQLTDGSFMVYDGGYPASADELLAFMQSRSGGAKPTVRAWVMTHLHGDHTGAFNRLAARENASELFKLEYMIYSPIPVGHPAVNRDEENPDANLKAFQRSVSRFPEAKLVYAHTGMQFRFCNLTVEILYTPESLYKNLRYPEAFNNTSILSRLKDEKGSMLFTGDLADLGAGLSVRLYGDALAADGVQMSHHGLGTCPLSFYNQVNAATLWYPCSTSFYEYGANKPLRDAVAKAPTTREIIIAGNGQATRPFPGS